MLAQSLSALLRRRLPRVHRPLRRAYAIAEYARWRVAARRASDAEPYGHEFWDLHADGAWDWSGFAACVLRATQPRRVVDLGCGDAKLLAAIRQLDPGVEVRGFDGSAAARARAAARGIPVEALDLPRLSAHGRRALRRSWEGVDASICLEVAEHLLPWHAGRLLDLLTACPVVLFSAAQPGQGGTVHVNERPTAYWIHRFRARGYDLAPDDDAFRSVLAALRLPPWYAANAHLFRRRSPGAR